jgi:ribosomal protein S6--L-glutamate ligase
MIAETPQAVTSLLETLWAMGQDIVLQQYIAEAKGRDLRAIVVGGRVVASMRRQAKAGEFRSNLHRGGLGVYARLDDAYRRAAVSATRVMGLEVAGVDMLETREGPKILEINSSPGLEGVERASGIDVATAIVGHAERYLAHGGRHRRHAPLDDERRLSRLRADAAPAPPTRPRLRGAARA